MKKKLSFISGLTAFALLVAPFATSTFAAEKEDDSTVVNNVYEVPADVYGVRDVVYGEEVTEDVYEEDVTDNVYEEVTEDVYGEDVTDNVYEEVTEDVYGEDVTDDVYEDVTEDVYEDVTDHVYGDGVTKDVYVAEAVLHTNEKGELEVLDYSAHSAVNVTVSKESIEQLLKTSPNTKSITINIGGKVEAELPISLLLQGIQLNAEPTPTNIKGAISEVYDFTLVNLETKQTISEFEKSPITLSFHITGKNINWDNVKVYYVKDGKLVEEAHNVKINKETGVISAEVTHFSEYGVFEVASAPAGADKTTGDKPATETKDNTSTTNDSHKGSVEKAGSTNTTEGHKLPVTATNSYNLLAFGLLIVALGGVLLLVRNRRMA
ncbi:LPXTG cell wall anchor domain-containing protein [Ferdinandcohnia sp. Marseille-Q9671]